MISIVIPVYNTEEYIVSCLDSLARQSYTDFEVIVVDDGSRDASAERIESFIADSKIAVSLIRTENRGVSAARNTGIQYAKGDYICFIDSDDMADSEYLSVLLTELTNAKADICFCEHRTVPEDCVTKYSFHESYSKEVRSKYEALSEMLYGDRQHGIWSLLCRRDILGENRFAEGCRFSEDLGMVWQLAASSEKIVFVSAPLYIYRVRGNSAMTVISESRLDGMRLFKQLEEFMRQNAPEFADEFIRYGVAKWVWSTIWQIANGSKALRLFKESIRIYNPDEHMRRLLDFKARRVALSAFVFVHSKTLYYISIKIFKRQYRSVGG